MTIGPTGLPEPPHVPEVHHGNIHREIPPGLGGPHWILTPVDTKQVAEQIARDRDWAARQRRWTLQVGLATRLLVTLVVSYGVFNVVGLVTSAPHGPGPGIWIWGIIVFPLLALGLGALASFVVTLFWSGTVPPIDDASHIEHYLNLQRQNEGDLVFVGCVGVILGGVAAAFL